MVESAQHLLPASSQSEVARLMQQIRDEYTSGNHALYSFTVLAPHDFITKRMENIAGHFDALRQIVDDDTMQQLLENLGDTNE
jgi:hypothetical protein